MGLDGVRRQCILYAEAHWQVAQPPFALYRTLHPFTSVHSSPAVKVGNGGLTRRELEGTMKKVLNAKEE